MDEAIASRLRTVQGDITQLAVDAIVSAANSALLGGGGVDGAIHRAAGPGLLEECRRVGGCPAGEARLTGGYCLPARYVIHAVGPVWHGGRCGEAALLKSCYRSALTLARDVAARTIAFPCISTGAYRYPKQRACETAVASVVRWLAENRLPETVTFCLFDYENAELYRNRLAQEQPPNG
ncbi:MAG: O-acetyl-ADP-ribose deacetylase [Pirellulales bacterium]|nr:O-acetyl-ADP-ribose deacetylase [Pirellulales bacterium]